LCPRACRIADGDRGWCGTRVNRGGTLFADVYGRPAAVRVDPIEKKPLHHFLPGSSILSIGTVGCNLDCAWCQNCGLSRAHPDDVAASPLPPGDVAALARRHGCASVAFTYNEPTVFAEYAADAADAAHAAGLKTVAVTNGYIAPEACRDLYRRIDAANVDLKSFRDATYRRFTGGTLAPVLDALTCMKALGTWIEVTTLVVPGINDDPAELAEGAAWIREHLGPDTPLHLSAFHPDHRMHDRPRTPAAALQRARDIASDAGLRFVYLGNVAGVDDDTRCPGCDRVVIARSGFAARVLLDARGCCRGCGAALPMGA
jgi:pyruvate formate lyase activating enzyme